jgi:predicted nucleic acid-binding protein
MLVLDASAVAELLLRRPAGEAVAARLREYGFDLHAPQLVDIEVLSALRRVVAAGDASPTRAAEAVTDLLDLPIERYAHGELIPRIWELRENFSAYDAAYLALAEVITDEGAPLLTADTRLARAAAAHTSVRVILAASSS